MRWGLVLMKLSVMVAFYNQAQYVDQSLGGVLGQKTNFDFEILVGDDGSSDETADKVRGWQKRYPNRIQLFVMDRDPTRKYDSIHRASANRLNLLKHASGEYFTVVDGDDYFTDMDKFQQQIDILDDPSNSACIGCGHELSVLHEDDNESRPVFSGNQFAEGRVDKWMYWATGSYLHAETIIFRNVFKNGMPPNCPQLYFDDDLITLFMLNYGDLYYLPKSMVVYRYHSDSIVDIWSMQSSAIRSLNFFWFDRANKVNPGLKSASLRRYFHILRENYKYRGEFSKPEYDSIRQKAIEENASEILRWLNYSQHSAFEKLLDHLSFYKKRILKHIYNLRGKRCRAVKPSNL